MIWTVLFIWKHFVPEKIVLSRFKSRPRGWNQNKAPRLEKHSSNNSRTHVELNTTRCIILQQESKSYPFRCRQSRTNDLGPPLARYQLIPDRWGDLFSTVLEWEIVSQPELERWPERFANMRWEYWLRLHCAVLRIYFHWMTAETVYLS